MDEQNSIRQLVIPSPVEALLWCLVGLAVLLVANIGKIWNFLSGVPASVIAEQSSLFGALSGWFLETEAKIDPRIVDFVVWVLVGTIAVGAIMLFQGWLQAAGKEVTLLEYMRSPSGRVHEVHAVVLRVGLRVFGLTGLLAATWFYLSIVASEFETIFFTSFVNIGEWQSWLWIVVAPIVTGMYLYGITIFARLVLLRTSNF